MRVSIIATCGIFGLLCRSSLGCDTGWAVTLLPTSTLSSPGAAARISNTGFSVAETNLWQCGTFLQNFTTEANAVNDAGHVAGHVGHPAMPQAVIWNGGDPVFLGTSGTSVAYGLNNNDVAVGYWSGQAFRWANGQMTAIVPAVSDAFDISNTGYVVGSVHDGSGRRAYRWFDGSWQNLGTLRGHNLSIAFGVNDAGDVVGYSNGPQDYIGFHWSANTMTALPQLGSSNVSVAFAINNQNEIVGYSSAIGFDQYHAVLWENGQVTDLQTRVWSGQSINLETAYDINDAGWIIGAAAGFTTAYLMRPAHHADVNCDGPVNIDDLVMVIGAWGACAGACPSDVDRNGAVDIDDLVSVITAWGPCAKP